MWSQYHSAFCFALALLFSHLSAIFWVSDARGGRWTAKKTASNDLRMCCWGRMMETHGKDEKPKPSLLPPLFLSLLFFLPSSCLVHMQTHYVNGGRDALAAHRVPHAGGSVAECTTAAANKTAAAPAAAKVRIRVLLDDSRLVRGVQEGHRQRRRGRSWRRG